MSVVLFILSTFQACNGHDGHYTVCVELSVNACPLSSSFFEWWWVGWSSGVVLLIIRTGIPSIRWYQRNQFFKDKDLVNCIPCAAVYQMTLE